MAFKTRGIVQFHEELGHSRPAVKEEKHRVRGIDALDDHGLRDAADLDRHTLGQAAGNDCPIDIAQRGMPDGRD